MHPHLFQIRNDAGAITSPYLYHTYVTTILIEGQYGSGIGNDTAVLLTAPGLASRSSHYNMYNVTVPHGRTATFTVGATVGGKTYTQSADFMTSSLGQCDFA